MTTSPTAPVALVTGAAKRLGSSIAEALHAEGYTVCLHYHRSAADASTLAATLNARRPNSAITVQADLSNVATASFSETDGSVPVTLFSRCSALVDACYMHWGRCDVLVNNASSFYPTPLLRKDAGEGGSSVGDKESLEVAAADLFGSNAIAPYFLIKAFAQRVADTRAEQRGTSYSIVNMVDAMTSQPLLGYTMYTMAKEALEGLTRSAALELASLQIRVNGVSPGLSVLPDDMPFSVQEDYRRKVPLYQRNSSAEEVSDVVIFLCSPKAKYITGTCIKVDGGYSLTRA
ncbi:pteridine reductase 1 [Leishmania tarentolae]|uniref:Pteridine reductase 1 n=2 Tax=Leishmania tarentolae TaxID=5689 RepID=PTR1_LEITA|nr:RecName: Full=Pteridine reductase 1; AltName: Full=H region methotrexate resistance protein [Leishmania tarentolae]1P33_A Chain A, Pteridine reductase 1 [Leishmania tarentolae]1P33_B Chain B, Pteridine reductase 1 [Leishmania tarentolae]1P33_C Chain C, Pteridine reductase 1 [Leishmania tarentolae]1P33_D Chain D, Pteridine reductase 1 [Leishmania tarentolae]CAA78031.1 Putative pyridine nucleotide linked dehydrogenase [Leishmania tarentolae]GET88674.1 pteridine reductase 1 [Leishmania tarent